MGATFDIHFLFSRAHHTNNATINGVLVDPNLLKDQVNKFFVLQMVCVLELVSVGLFNTELLVDRLAPGKPENRKWVSNFVS